MNSLKKDEGVPPLHFEGGPGVPLIKFKGGTGVPLLNFRGVPGPTFKLTGFQAPKVPDPKVPRSRVPGSWSHFYTMPFRMFEKGDSSDRQKLNGGFFQQVLQ